jgi:uncharacterized protein
VREVDVVELFVDPAKREDDEDDEPGYELLDAATAIDLSTMVRDALCSASRCVSCAAEDCQGLCPTCGTDRNRTDCGHRTDARSTPALVGPRRPGSPKD